MSRIRPPSAASYSCLEPLPLAVRQARRIAARSRSDDSYNPTGRCIRSCGVPAATTLTKRCGQLGVPAATTLTIRCGQRGVPAATTRRPAASRCPSPPAPARPPPTVAARCPHAAVRQRQQALLCQCGRIRVRYPYPFMVPRCPHGAGRATAQTGARCAHRPDDAQASRRS